MSATRKRASRKMRISTIGYTMKQGVKNIGRNKMFSLASIATMSACIFMFGLFYSIIVNFQNIVKSAEEGVAITVFFDEDIDDTRMKEIATLIQKRDEVGKMDFVSGEQAWEDFKVKYFGEDLEYLSEGFAENPLLNSDNLQVYMKDVSGQQQLVEYIEGLDGVRDVNRSDTVAKTLSGANKLILYVSAAIIIILLAVSVFLISNTVAMGISIRREEIAIMKYIGAKDSFVRMPFVIEGLLIGLVGAIIPLAALFFLYEKAVAYVLMKFQVLSNLLSFLPVTEVYRTLLPVGIALGIGIGFLGSFSTTRKHLKV